MHSISRLMSRASRFSVSVLMVPSSVGSARSGRQLGLLLGLQVAVHEVDLLQPAKALADVLRTDLPHALDGLEFAVCGCEHFVESSELPDDLLHHELWKPRDAPQYAIPAGRHGEVKRVGLAVVAEELRQAAEVEKVLVRQA